MAQYPLINGNRYSWSSITITLKGKTLTPGVKEFSYSHKLEPTKVMGTHPQPIGRTRGKYDADASITLYRQEADELRAALGPGYMEQVFDIVCSYADDGQPTVTDTIQGCRIKGEDNSYSEGTDPLAIKFDLDVLAVKMGGVAPLKNPLY